MGICEEKLRLTQAYQDANKRFSDALATLAQQMGTLTRDEYDRLRQKTDELRIWSEGTRLALERHILQHGC